MDDLDKYIEHRKRRSKAFSGSFDVGITNLKLERF